MATVRCLLEANKVLPDLYDEDERVKRMVRGVFAFFLYAADFWLDALIYEVDDDENQLESCWREEFMVLSSSLAATLNCSSNALSNAPAPQQLSSFGPLLDKINRYGPELLSMTKAAISNRTKTSLDSRDSPCMVAHVIT
jgi:hypothetical protein